MATQLEGGHKETILCVTSTNQGQLVSGGDGGELCFWPLDGGAPQTHVIDSSDITSLVCPSSNVHDLFIAAGQKVFCYDMRQMSQPVHIYESNEDEVNHLALHEKEEYLAACDDSGQIKIYNLQTKRVYKTLRKHVNICSSVAFRPGRPWELISAGLDCNLLQWDFSKNRVFCSVDMTELRPDEDDAESYLVNPPFIYNMQLSPDGLHVACGLENALVQVFNSSKRTLAFMCTLRGHSNGVSQVHFPTFSSNLLVSGGNDGKLLFWDMSDCTERLTNGHTVDNHSNGHAPANGHAHENSHADGNGHAHANGNGHDHPQQPAAAAHHPSVSPKHLIQHGDKINWITSIVKNEQNTIVVADNSNKLTLYPLTE